MKYKPYAEYKDSGIEWIGDIPKEWEVKKLKYIGKAIIGLTYSPEQIVSDAKQGTLVFRSSNVQDGKISYSDAVYVETEVPEKLYVRKGDILICSRNGSKALIGKNALISEADIGNTFGAFMTIFRSKYYYFLHHVLNSKIFEFQADSCMTTTVNQLTTANLNSMEIPLPPISEQIAIANYLDIETSKIASIISAKQNLIEKLKEKCSSIIYHVVTKGLDPTVKMKPSGIEWIGNIPEGWEVKKLKYVSTISTGNTPSKSISDFYCDDGLAWVKPDNLNEFIPIRETKEYLSEAGIEVSRIAKAKSVLVCCIGTVGKFGYSLNDVAYNQQINAVTFNGKINWKYGLYYISAQQEQHKYFMNGNVVYILNGESQKQIMVSVPPINEQITIADYLDTETAKIDNIIAKTKTSIEKLNEYKTSLITACVTGKIDVRGQQNERSN